MGASDHRQAMILSSAERELALQKQVIPNHQAVGDRRRDRLADGAPRGSGVAGWQCLCLEIRVAEQVRLDAVSRPPSGCSVKETRYTIDQERLILYWILHLVILRHTPSPCDYAGCSKPRLWYVPEIDHITVLVQPSPCLVTPRRELARIRNQSIVERCTAPGACEPVAAREVEAAAVLSSGENTGSVSRQRQRMPG